MNQLKIPLMLLLCLMLSSCSKENIPESEIWEIAWSSLSEAEKSTITVDWRAAPVADTTYHDTRAYSVTFSTSVDNMLLLGPIVIYVDFKTKAVLGRGLRW